MFLVGMYRGYSAFGKIFHEMSLSEQTLGDQLQKTAGFMERLASINNTEDCTCTTDVERIHKF